MAYFTPKCGGIKLSTASMKQIGKVITDVNATSIGDTLVTSCGQLFDGAYFTKVGKTIALAGATTITGKQVANCCLPFDSGSFAVDEDGAIEYAESIISALSVTATPSDAIILVTDENDMVIEEQASGGYAVIMGRTYTVTGTAEGYISASVEVDVDEAVEEVDLTLTMPELTINVTNTDVTTAITVVDDEAVAVQPNEDGSYYVLMGRTYTYTVTADGYNTEIGSITPTGEATITVTLDPELAEIVVTTPPTKTAYTIGESFDPAGMVITANYMNSATATVTGYTYAPNGALTIGDTTITITYTENDITQTATQTITIS